MLTHPKVTLIISPRERFSLAQRSLENLYENTTYPFNLIYVDGNSPPALSHYLRQKSKEKGFRLIRTNHYLSPNQARNLAIPEVETEYIVFVDNDILFQPGWLQALVECADRTGAWAVTPLTLEDDTWGRVHFVGGELVLRELKDGRRWLIEKRPFMHMPLSKVQSKLVAQPTGLTEFHTVLARRDMFDRVGLLDEKFLSLAEETDFCFSILQAGGSIYFEPKSVIAYPVNVAFQWSDLPFFFIRWSETWGRETIKYVQTKYNLSPDSPVLNHYRVFVYDHRQLAFGDHNELSFKALLLTSELSLADKGRYLAKKILRRQMDRYATRQEYMGMTSLAIG